MNTIKPSISISLYHFWFTCHSVIALLDVSTIYLHLPISTILNAIRRIKVDALYLPLHALTIQ